jgi:carbamoyl-phosphate synthase large subunit
VQYAICNDKVYILEANPRASRTVPVVSKMTGVSMARVATKLMLGKKISEFPELQVVKLPYVGVKEAVFPFNMFPEVDPVLGPEMRATGEVMGMADNFGVAFYKAQTSTGNKLPLEGTALLTVADKDKKELVSLAKKLIKLGFKIRATAGTAAKLEADKVTVEVIKKINEGRPNIEDAIKNREINLIINTPAGKNTKYDDSYIRMMAIQHKLSYVTTLAAAHATVEGIEAVKKEKDTLRCLQEYHASLKKKEKCCNNA